MGPNEPSARQMVTDAATLIALVAAWLYVAGWTYARHYFRRFEVGLLGLDIPHEYYLMYGSWVVKRWWWAVLIMVLIALISYYWPPVRGFWLGRGRPLAVVLVCVAFLLAPFLGRQSAHAYYERWSGADFRPYPRVKVWLKPNAQDPAVMQAIAEDLPEGCHRLLLQSKSALYVFRPRADVSPLQLAVTALPLSEVRSVRVIPQYDSCP